MYHKKDSHQKQILLLRNAKGQDRDLCRPNKEERRRYQTCRRHRRGGDGDWGEGQEGGEGSGCSRKDCGSTGKEHDTSSEKLKQIRSIMLHTSWLPYSTYLYLDFHVFHDKAKRTQQGNLLAPYVIFLNFGTPPVKSMPTNASICDKKWPKYAKILHFLNRLQKKYTNTTSLLQGGGRCDQRMAWGRPQRSF